MTPLGKEVSNSSFIWVALRLSKNKDIYSMINNSNKITVML